MDYTLFIKNKFLNQSIDNFAQSFDRIDYKGLEKIVSRNTVFGSGKIAMAVCRKDVKSVFESVDGIPLNTDGATVIRKDGYVDRDEFYQLINTSYKTVYGQEITGDELSKMTVKDAIEMLIKYFKKSEQ